MLNSYAHIAVISVAGALAYSNSFFASFHFDDFRNIVCNPAMLDPWMILFPDSAPAPDIAQELRLRPVGFLSFAFNVWLGGLATTGFHAFNFAVHLVNSILVYFLVMGLFRCPAMLRMPPGAADSAENGAPRQDSDAGIIAFAASLIFMIHPVQTQAVTYIVQRFASLAAMFYLSACMLYIKARMAADPGGQGISLRTAGLYAGSLLCALLAVKTKENTYTIPLAVTLVELFFFEGKLGRRLLLLVPFYLLLVLLPLSIGMIGSGVPGDFAGGKVLTDMSRTDYFLTGLTAIIFYFRLLILPYGQNLEHDFPARNELLDPAVIFSLIVVAFLILAALFAWQRTSRGRWDPKLRLAAFGILWFFATISAESGLVPIADLVFEHRVYLPSPGIIMAVAAVVLLAWRRCGFRGAGAGRSAACVFAAYVATLVSATFSRNMVWKDEISLWEDCAAKSPRKPRVLNTLGAVYIDAGRHRDARPVLLKTLEVEPENWPAHKNLAACYSLAAAEAKASGADEQTRLNLWGLSVMHAKAAEIMMEDKDEDRQILKKLLDDIAKVEKRLSRQSGL